VCQGLPISFVNVISIFVKACLPIFLTVHKPSTPAEAGAAVPARKRVEQAGQVPVQNHQLHDN
jgi:hypothetical protein